MRRELRRKAPRSPLRGSYGQPIRGQAMLEYSIVVFAMVFFGGATLLTVLPMLMNALDRYLQGFYFMLNLALP